MKLSSSVGSGREDSERLVSFTSILRCACWNTGRCSSAAVHPWAKRGMGGGTRRGEGTETKLGPSELMQERHRRENREAEREKECPSNGYTETQREIKGAREDLSLEDMSNSHATGSNAWESRQLLSGLTATPFNAYSAKLQWANQPALSCRDTSCSQLIQKSNCQFLQFGNKSSSTVKRTNMRERCPGKKEKTGFVWFSKIQP